MDVFAAELLFCENNKIMLVFNTLNESQAYSLQDVQLMQVPNYITILFLDYESMKHSAMRTTRGSESFRAACTTVQSLTAHAAHRGHCMDDGVSR